MTADGINAGAKAARDTVTLLYPLAASFLSEAQFANLAQAVAVAVLKAAEEADAAAQLPRIEVG